MRSKGEEDGADWIFPPFSHVKDVDPRQKMLSAALKVSISTVTTDVEPVPKQVQVHVVNWFRFMW